MNINVTTIAVISVICVLIFPLMAYGMARKKGLNAIFWVSITFVLSIFGIFGLIPVAIMWFRRPKLDSK